MLQLEAMLMSVVCVSTRNTWKYMISVAPACYRQGSINIITKVVFMDF